MLVGIGCNPFSVILSPQKSISLIAKRHSSALRRRPWCSSASNTLSRRFKWSSNVADMTQTSSIYSATCSGSYDLELVHEFTGGRGPLKPEMHNIKFSYPLRRAKRYFAFVLLVHRNLVIVAGQVYGAKVSRPSHVIDDLREVTRRKGMIFCFHLGFGNQHSLREPSFFVVSISELHTASRTVL